PMPLQPIRPTWTLSLADTRRCCAEAASGVAAAAEAAMPPARIARRSKLLVMRIPLNCQINGSANTRAGQIASGGAPVLTILASTHGRADRSLSARVGRKEGIEGGVIEKQRRHVGRNPHAIGV